MRALFAHQIGKVSRMQKVTDLLAGASKAGVTQGATKAVPGYPQGEDALVGTAKLPRASDDAATVDDSGDTAIDGVLFNEEFGSKLAATVERAKAGADGWEVFGDTIHAVSRGQAGCGLRKGDVAQGGDAVDAAGGDKDEPAAAGAREFETVDGANEVGIEQVLGTAGCARVYTGLGRRLYEQRDGAFYTCEVRRIAHVAMDELDASGFQKRDV